MDARSSRRTEVKQVFRGGTIREIVEARYLYRTGRAIDLDNPRGYNEKIQWLKVNDQMPEMIVCCDKLAVRAHVSPTPEVFDVAETFEELPYRAPVMVKASHDSGSVALVVDEASWQRAGKRIRRGLARTYGVISGEWAYQHVPPRCFTERVLPGPVVDYKFHCVSGEIRWVQIISERNTGHPLEVIVDRQGRPMGLHLDHEMRHGTQSPLPDDWDRLAEKAEVLAKPFRYVRVDLYAGGWFGEMTFWPKSGFYRTRDEPVFGDMLDFDMFVRPQVHP